MDNGYDFYNSLKTDRDKTLALLFLNGFSENLFRTDASLANFLKRNEADTFAKMVIAELPPDWQSMEDKSKIQERILEIKKRIEVLPTIGITIAIEPNNALLNSLEDWAARNFDYKVIFDIRVNPDVLGGAIIVKSGSYRDFSLSRKLKEVLSERQDEIMKTLLKKQEA